MNGVLRFPTLHEQIEDLFEFSQNPQQRVRTGLDRIDTICGGPAPGEVFMILGRSFAGKSLVGQNICYHNRHLPGIFFSLEMPYLQALQRLYAIWSSTPARDVQLMTENGNLPLIVKEMADEFEYHRIVDAEGISLDTMGRYIEAFDKYYGERPQYVVIDYLELLGGAKKSGEGWLGTEVAATSLKDWAKMHNMPVFVLHQANMQENPWSPPTPNSARGGGFTEADFVVGMWNESRNPSMSDIDRSFNENLIRFNILKNRAYGELSYGRDKLNYQIAPSLRLEQA